MTNNTEEDARNLETEGKKYLEQKDYDKAIEFFEKSLDFFSTLGLMNDKQRLKSLIVEAESLKNQVMASKIAQENSKKSKIEIEREAESFIGQAKQFAFENKINEAIECYKKVIQIYEQIEGYSFQIKRFNWEIQKLSQQKPATIENKAEGTHKGAADRFKSIAEEREERLRKEKEKKEEQERLKKAEEDAKIRVKQNLMDERRKILQRMSVETNKEYLNLVNTEVLINDAIRFDDFENRYKKALESKLVQAKKDKMNKDAEMYLDQAKVSCDLKKFDLARDLYKKAADIYEQLGWHDQAVVLRREIEVVRQKETDYKLKEKKQEEEQQRKLKEHEDLLKREQEEKEKKRKQAEEEQKERDRRAAEEQLRKQKEIEELVRKDQEEKERQRKLKEEEAKRRSPEEQNKIEIAKLNITKGKQAEEKEKFGQAMQRYQYALEIFEELKYEQAEIDAVKKMIQKIEAKAKLESIRNTKSI